MSLGAFEELDELILSEELKKETTP